MTDKFHSAFEDKHRGSRDLIKSRLQVYLPFVLPLLKSNPKGKALDLGCGRGEWLELLGQQGFDVLGIDLDDGMLQACRERKLNVKNTDAKAYLQSLPNTCLCILSGFHIAEFLPFEELQTIVYEALRVLMPGGLLILETPNPENIILGSDSFCLDPTHQGPIPPQLLSFLPEYFGFKRWKIMRLQESPYLHNTNSATLVEVLKGVSPDYALVAQKGGPNKLNEQMNEAFETEYGLTLDSITEKFQGDLNFKSNLSLQLQQALEVAQAAQLQAKQMGLQLEQAKDQLQEQERQIKEQRQQVLTNNHYYWQLASNKAEKLSKLFTLHEQTNLALHSSQLEVAGLRAEVELRAGEIQYWHKRVLDLHSSRSWRLTKPLRGLKRLFSCEVNVNQSEIYPFTIKLQDRKQVLLEHCISYVVRRPWLKKILCRALAFFPSLERRLIEIREVQIRSELLRKSEVIASVSVPSYIKCAKSNANSFSPGIKRNVNEILDHIRTDLRL